jgi:hypothetical protein
MPRLLSPDGEFISRLESFDVVDSAEMGSSFSAIIPDGSDVGFRRGFVLIEADDGSRFSAEVEHAEVVPDPFGLVLRVTGFLVTSRS